MTDTDERLLPVARYAGDHGKAGVLAFRTATLTVLTLGIYRFWMKTRLRRFFWSSVSVDNEPLEYTGTGLELFLGFLIAMIVLALYLTPVNFLLSYIDLALWGDNPFATYASFLAALPLIYYAFYRGRRYLLARTKWRGVRFAMEPGGWGYALRGMLWTAALVFSAGLAKPAMDWALEHYKSNRTWFGDRKVTMEGKWTPLMKPYLVFWFAAAVIMLAPGILLFVFQATPAAASLVKALPFLLLVGVPFLFYFWQRYSAARFRHFAANRRLGDTIHFQSNLEGGSLFWMYFGGYLLLMLTLGFLGFVVTFLAVPIMTAFVTPDRIQAINEAIMVAQNEPLQWVRVLLFGWPMLLLTILFYGSFFAISTALWTSLIASRRIELMFRTLRISNIEDLHSAAQRTRDESREAGGFADAFDVDVGFGL